jgi:hypothetical protein
MPDEFQLPINGGSQTTPVSVELITRHSALITALWYIIVDALKANKHRPCPVSALQ